MPDYLFDKRFWKDFGRGFLPRNAGSRAGQVLTHGVTDFASGVSDLVGVHGSADKIRKWQASMDNTYDSLMDADFRREYRDNKFGRAAGEVASAMVPGILGGALSRAVPGKVVPGNGLKFFPKLVAGKGGNFIPSRLVGTLNPAVDSTRKASTLARIASRAVRKIPGKSAARLAAYLRKPVAVKKLTGTGLVGRLVKIPGVESKLLSRLLTNRYAMEAAGAMSGVAAHVRGGSIDTRDTSRRGDVNPVMRLKDILSREWLVQRAALGSERDYDRAASALEKFDRLYRSSGESDGVRDMTRNGKTVFQSDRFGRLAGKFKVNGSNAQRRMDRLMSLANRYYASKEAGGFGTSLIGKILGFGQPSYNAVPAIEVVNEGGKNQLRFSPQANIDMNGRYSRENIYHHAGDVLDAKRGHGRLFRRIGSAFSFIPQSVAYTTVPWLNAAGTLSDGIRSGNGSSMGAGAGLLAAQSLNAIPGFGKAPMLARILSSIGIPIAGSVAGGAYLGDPSKADVHRDRMMRELHALQSGSSTENFFANTKRTGN